MWVISRYIVRMHPRDEFNIMWWKLNGKCVEKMYYIMVFLLILWAISFNCEEKILFFLSMVLNVLLSFDIHLFFAFFEYFNFTKSVLVKNTLMKYVDESLRQMILKGQKKIHVAPRTIRLNGRKESTSLRHITISI